MHYRVLFYGEMEEQLKSMCDSEINKLRRSSSYCVKELCKTLEKYPDDTDTKNQLTKEMRIKYAIRIYEELKNTDTTTFARCKICRMPYDPSEGNPHLMNDGYQCEKFDFVEKLYKEKC